MEPDALCKECEYFVPYNQTKSEDRIPLNCEKYVIDEACPNLPLSLGFDYAPYGTIICSTCSETHSGRIHSIICSVCGIPFWPIEKLRREIIEMENGKKCKP